MQNSFNSEYSGFQELNDTQENLIYYSKSIVLKFYNFFSKNLSLPHPKVLEFGAGSGSLALLWEDLSSQKPSCVEIDKQLIKLLVAKGFVCETSIGVFKTEFDFVYSSNVLEHIEDDVEALTELRKFTARGGYLALYVPANQFLFNQMDMTIGHYRRYGKKELISKVTAAGWTVVKFQWDDSLGVFALILLKLIGYKNQIGLGGPISLKVYDLVINPISRILDRVGARFLFGKNILLFARNQENLND